MLLYTRWRVSAPSTHRGADCHPPIAWQRENDFAAQTTETQNNLPKNPRKSAFIFGESQVVDDTPKDVLWLRNGEDSWSLVTRRKYKMYRIPHCIKRMFFIPLIRKAETAADNFDFAAVHRIKKEHASGSRSFHGILNDVNSRLFIHGNEQLKKGSRNLSWDSLLRFHLSWMM